MHTKRKLSNMEAAVPGYTDEDIAKARIFRPQAVERYLHVRDTGGKFAHYTDAVAAMSILSRKQFWLRNVTTMNDISEVHHGLDCLISAYKSPIGDRLKRLIGSVAPGLPEEIEKLFDGWSPHFTRLTYIACFSEHDTKPPEEVLGRLSMWRAYGAGAQRVAIILNNTPFLNVTDAFEAYAYPVEYKTSEEFRSDFDQLVAKAEGAGPMISTLGREWLHGAVFDFFKTAVLCTKHPGFIEEREWRVVHTPEMNLSDNLLREVETVRGTPQIVYKIPLKNIPDKGLVGIEPNEILHRVIIGPSDSAHVVREAFIELLQKENISDAATRVTISGIPLR